MRVNPVRDCGRELQMGSEPQGRTTDTVPRSILRPEASATISLQRPNGRPLPTDHGALFVFLLARIAGRRLHDRTPLMRPHILLVTLPIALLACAQPRPLPDANPTPADGTALVTRMHDRYAGRWYQSVTFTQTTTQHLPDGSERVSTWHEALRAPGVLRIDVGAPADGNVVIYTRDSSYRVRGGTLVRSAADANPFMPFVATMYHVPVSETLGELARWHFDLSRIRADTLAGRPTWVVGARDASDTTSPQFWVDAERLVATRIILAPEATTPALDIALGGYQPLGGGWIATDVDIRSGGKSVQREQYADLRADVSLPASMFDPHQWPAAAPPVQQPSPR